MGEREVTEGEERELAAEKCGLGLHSLKCGCPQASLAVYVPG